MKILLLFPPFPHQGMDQAMRSPPLGLMSIAGAVPEGHEIRMHDLKVNPLPDEKVKKLIEWGDIVGLSISSLWVPVSFITPSSNVTIFVACFMVLSLCAITNTVLPSMRWFMASWTSLSDSVSS